ncbi:MAG TPA: DEAD/DEAH box helicase [Tepidisphaeraceae bacterium]|jgi:superfamily II DNA or RNA helicase
MELVNTLKSFVNPPRQKPNRSFEFQEIIWKWPKLSAKATYEGGALAIILDMGRGGVAPTCSLCGKGQYCPHVGALMGFLDETGIATEIQQNDFASCTYTLRGKRTNKPQNPWKSQLNKLAEQCKWLSTDEPAPIMFPSAREVIYVLQEHRYRQQRDLLEIHVVTRPLDPAKRVVNPKAVQSHSSRLYRNFSAGVRGLAASDDPLDREIAERLLLTQSEYEFESAHVPMRLFLSPQNPGDLIAKLARSGRLFLNREHFLNDKIFPLDWLGDEQFDLKFELADGDSGELMLGLCAVSNSIKLAPKELVHVWPWGLIDAQNRLGLFRCRASEQLIAYFKNADTIRVPRGQAPELIERLMSLPVGIGIEFSGCQDIRPSRLVIVPKPMIHIKAMDSSFSEALQAEVFFDYEGLKVSPHRRITELYDKQRSALIEINADFHKQSLALLDSIGVKLRREYDGLRWKINKKKLPAVVGQLIYHGWHVEADGKLYRTARNFEMSIVSGIDWFELQGKAHFEQTSIDLPKLLSALRSGEKTVILDDGSIGMIPEEWIKRFGTVADLARTEEGTVRFGFSQVGLLDALLAERGEVDVDEKFIAARQSLRAFDRISPVEAPQGFNGTLRPYQKIAQGWFEFLRQLGFGGCLADDMGLGKTVQVLAMLEGRRQQTAGPSLIVVPRSLIFNWIAEAKKFAPGLRVLDQSHAQRTRGTEHLANFDLVLTTYGTLRRDAAFLKDFEFDYVVLDEAQAIKNASTEAAKAARLLQGRHKLTLTGTPIENHLGELWSMFDFLNPGMLGRLGRFTSIADDADPDQRKFLASAVRPFILRRTKKQVAPELPERVEQTVIVELDPEQRKSYDELRDFYRQSLLKKIDTDGMGKSQIVILEALLRLRQAACHPGLLDKSAIGKSSAKLNELLQRLSSAIESDERVLVFSQFTSFLAIVKQRLKEAKIDFLYLDGKTRNRQALVDQFQSGSGPSVFLISLKAGGVGLNLTAARTVILLDPWWNPAVEAQAIDRSHRIGQQMTVFASRLIAANTVEQKVLELQARKKGLADAIVNVDNGGISSLTRQDLEVLLA